MSSHSRQKSNSAQRSARIGVDENGLGARLGPLTVTAVWAEVDERGKELLQKPLPDALRADLDDSKVLVSCHDVSLGEAWARALIERSHPELRLEHPSDLLDRLALEPREERERPCPPSSRAQCWSVSGELFEAREEQLSRLREHFDWLEARGVRFLGAQSSLVCTGTLNQLKSQGVSRFTADLHAMERLILALHERAGREIEATCGKVGGMGQYGRFFGPLSQRLYTPLVEGQAESAYHFPGLGTVRFVRDADALDPLVMLASLIGKYVRELLMRRIAHYYREGLGQSRESFTVPSGYHDPVSNRFVTETGELRRRLQIASACFERVTNEKKPQKVAPESTPKKRGRPTRTVQSPESPQAALFEPRDN